MPGGNGPAGASNLFEKFVQQAGLAANGQQSDLLGREKTGAGAKVQRVDGSLVSHVLGWTGSHENGGSGCQTG